MVDLNSMGGYNGKDAADMTERGTALGGCTAQDLLAAMNVSHLRASLDAVIVVRRNSSFESEDIERAAIVIMDPAVKELVRGPGPSTVAIDGHFDRLQTGKISPLSYVSAMLSQAIRQQYAQYGVSGNPGLEKENVPRVVVLEYYCALHTATDDDLLGPQGLMRCLTTQLLLALLANEWIGQAEAVNLPHLGDGEDELLEQKNLEAICRLFVGLVLLVPRDVPIFCFVDGWSTYERESIGREDYNTVLAAFRDACDSTNPEGCADFRLILSSPTASRWLDDFIMPGQRVSLRNREAVGRNWHGPGRSGLMGLARAATMPDVNSGLRTGPERSQSWTRPSHDRRSST
jgi:hypothetical protein